MQSTVIVGFETGPAQGKGYYYTHTHIRDEIITEMCFSSKVDKFIPWIPDEFSPAHNIWGREVRSGIAPLGRNYARPEAGQTNQIVRAGFIRLD